MTHLTIAVCTRQRPGPLKHLLRSIEEASTPKKLEIDLVVVWNDRPGPDYEEVQIILENLNYSAILVLEPSTGLSYARNRALSIADGDFVYFIDDDIVVSKSTFIEFENYLAQNQPEILGTRVLLYDESDFEITIRTGSEPSRLSKNQNPFGFIHGCSLLLSKNVIRRVGFFNTLLGPGSKLRAADDLDYILRGFSLGITVDYTPSIMVYHNHGRKCLAEVLPLLDGYMMGNGAVVGINLARLQIYPLVWELKIIGDAVRESIKFKSLRHLYIWALRNIWFTLWGSISYPLYRFKFTIGQILR